MRLGLIGMIQLSLMSLLLGCAVERSLVVQLTSNLVPGREINRARVVVSAAGRILSDDTVDLPPSRSLGRPVRLTSLTGLAAGPHEIRVTVLRGTFVVQSRRVIRQVDGATVVTLLMTRECNGVMCPAADGDPTAVECLGGRCVPDVCDEEHPQLCPAPECVRDVDCTARAVSCAVQRCSSSGTCFASADDARCAPGQTCDTAIGCVDPVGCVLSPWSAPRAVPELSSSATEFTGEVRPDGLSIYLSSDRSGQFDLYRATRSDRAAAFDSPALVPDVDDAGYQGDSTTTIDDLQLVYANADCLDLALRAGTTEAFVRSSTFDSICGADVIVGGPYLALDGLTLYYTRFRIAPLKTNSLWTMTRVTTRDVFAGPTPVAGFDDAANMGYAGLSADQLTMWLERHQPGDVDIVVTTRASSGDAWLSPRRFDEASIVGFDDGDPTITGDGLELYFTSNRSGGLGDHDVWVISRTCD